MFTKASQFWLSSSHLRSISEQLLPNNAVLFNNKMQKLEYSQDRYFWKSGKINESSNKSTFSRL